MIICSACRSELPEESRFCGACGFKLESAPDYAAAAPTDEPVMLLTPKAAHAPAPASRQAPAPDPEPIVLSQPRPTGAQARAGAMGGGGTKSAEFKRIESPGGRVTYEEVRNDAREALAVEVTFESEHNFYTGLVENISAGGLFVATGEIRPIGTRFAVEFSLPGLGRPCRALCEVRWVRDYNSARELPSGLGLAFVELFPSDARAIEAFLAHREALFFDE
jgi:uncharacterized protein (TIGR02266 family)